MAEWDEPEVDPYYALMDLVDGGRKTEAVYKSSPPFHDFLDHSNLDETAEEFRREFDEIVRELVGALGQPRFMGDRHRTGFPSWSTALQLAIWSFDDDLAGYLAVHHERRDDPFQLRFGVR